MASIRLVVDSTGITVPFSRIWDGPCDQKVRALLVVKVGDDDVKFTFPSADELIAFCEAHNFPYQDDRSQAEKE